MTTRADKRAREVVRIFRIVVKLEDQLQEAHAVNDWPKAWEVAVRLRRAIKRSSGMVDGFANAFDR